MVWKALKCPWELCFLGALGQRLYPLGISMGTSMASVAGGTEHLGLLPTSSTGHSPPNTGMLYR